MQCVTKETEFVDRKVSLEPLNSHQSILYAWGPQCQSHTLLLSSGDSNYSFLSLQLLPKK